MHVRTESFGSTHTVVTVRASSEAVRERLVGFLEDSDDVARYHVGDDAITARTFRDSTSRGYLTTISFGEPSGDTSEMHVNTESFDEHAGGFWANHPKSHHEQLIDELTRYLETTSSTGSIDRSKAVDRSSAVSSKTPEEARIDRLMKWSLLLGIAGSVLLFVWVGTLHYTAVSSLHYIGMLVPIVVANVVVIALRIKGPATLRARHAAE